MFRLALLVLVLAGGILWYASRDPPLPGPAAPVEITEILRDPARYDGRTIQVRGTVIDRVSLFGAGAWRIGGADGSRLVVVGLATAPPPGSPIIARGVFRVAGSFGNHLAPVLVASE